MAVNRLTYKFMTLVAMLAMFATGCIAQTLELEKNISLQKSLHNDTLDNKHEKMLLPKREHMDSVYMDITAETGAIYTDSISLTKATQQKNSKKIGLRKPDPETATWLALAIPGGGQIYNRKFWKLPIVYGGVVGCVYAVSWNGQMLRDYSQAYQDIMDNDPTTNSHLEMLPLGYDITGREDHFKSVFKRKKDSYRRFRDLSIFCIAGVYLLSIIDAYVDAELSTFDIGTDLSMTVSPGMIPAGSGYSAGPINGTPGITIQLNY